MIRYFAGQKRESKRMRADDNDPGSYGRGSAACVSTFIYYVGTEGLPTMGTDGKGDRGSSVQP